MSQETITETMLRRASAATLTAALAGETEGAARAAGFAGLKVPRVPRGTRLDLTAWFEGLHRAVSAGVEGAGMRALHRTRQTARDYTLHDAGPVRSRIWRRVQRRLGRSATAVGCEAPGVATQMKLGGNWSVEVTHSLGDNYSSRCTWRKREYTCTLSVPVALARGLVSGKIGRESIGGMPTWHGLPAGDGTSAAWWVESGRGYALIARSGYVARVGDVVAHGPTEADALAAASKTHRRLHRPEAKCVDEAARFQRRVVRLKRYWALVVGVDDSLAAGNCDSGTASWAARFAGGRSEATVREVLEVALTCGVEIERAVAACEAAVRRLRSTANASATAGAVVTSSGEETALAASAT